MSIPTAPAPVVQTLRGTAGLKMLGDFGDALFKVVGLLAALFGTYTTFVGRDREQVISFVVVLLSVLVLGWRLWPEKPRTISVPVIPAIRGLLSFNEGDVDRLFGRETEIGTLLNQVNNGQLRVTLVRGEASSGKTSLLRGGLVPRLDDKKWLPLYVADASVDLLNDIRRELADKGGFESQALSLEQTIRRCVESTQRTPVIICDQFERLFISDPAADTRNAVFAAMRQCLAADDLPFRFVICSRSGFDTAKALESGLQSGIVPLPAQTTVARFAPDRADEVLGTMAEHDKIPFTPGLRAAIVRDLTYSNSVCPAELQSIAVWLRDNGITTLAGYEGLGRSEGFFRDYVRTIAKSVDDVTSMQAARHVFAVLAQRVDGSTQASATRDEIVASYGAADHATVPVQQEAIDRALQHLVANGIVTQVAGGVYALIHPYFAPGIRRALAEPTRRRQIIYWRARQMVTAYGRRTALAAIVTPIALAAATVALGAPGAQPRWALNGQGGTLQSTTRWAFDPDNAHLAIDDGSKLVVWDLTPDRLLAWDVPRKTPLRIIQHQPKIAGQVGVWLPAGAGFLSDGSEAYEVSLNVPENRWRVDHVRLNDEQRVQPLEGRLIAPEASAPCSAMAAAYSAYLDVVAVAYSCGGIVLLPSGRDPAKQVRTVAADEDKSCMPSKIALSGSERHLAVVYTCSVGATDAPSTAPATASTQRSKLRAWNIQSAEPSELETLDLSFVENNTIASVMYRWDGDVTIGVGSKSDFVLYDVSKPQPLALVYTHAENRFEPNLVWLGTDGRVVAIQHDTDPPELQLQTVDLWVGPFRVPPFLPFRRDVSGVAIWV
jgi:hypothetical protein